jgi:hypothetical protein
VTCDRALQVEQFDGAVFELREPLRWLAPFRGRQAFEVGRRLP